MTLKKEGYKFKWTDEANKVFIALKEAIKNAVSLHIPRLDRPFTSYSDASDKAIAFVLEQTDEEGRKVPITQLSKMLSPQERKYSVYRT